LPKGGGKVDTPKQPPRNQGNKTTEGHSNRGLPRRDALKSLIAGFTAVPLLNAAIRRGEPRAPGAAAPFRDDDSRSRLFDGGWRFHRGDASGAEAPDFDDHAWRQLDLPHDWSVEALAASPASSGEGAVWGAIDVPLRIGPFDIYRSEGKRDTGWFVGGTGWYRKRFTAAELREDSQSEVAFDGVYMASDVWLNGNHLGNHPYGYTSFAYDLTPYLKRQGENVLAVRVQNEGRNSRWYSGSGIYRHVWLHATGPVRVPLWGVVVTTHEVSAQSASVKVAVKVENREPTAREVTVRIRLLDAKGAVVGTHESAREVAAGGETEVEQTIVVANPQLWSPASPNLYGAEIELIAGGAVVDSAVTSFGIRKVEVDAERGLRINGEAVKLRGGCMHHANGLLGAAAIDRAEERRVELMKAHGFNAIRCAHNPPSPAFLDACDRLGVLVIDEAFDQWTIQKNPQDYHLYFQEWWRRDVDSMVRRDCNHPSVIFWSIGNEIPERADPPGVAIARQMVAEVKRLDPTRPVTAAIPAFFESGGRRPWVESDPAFQSLDVGGYNYQWEQYEKDHERLPDRIMMGTESFPLQAFENWQQVEKHPYVLGDFVWTGMDYLGESGIGNAQLRSNARGEKSAPEARLGVVTPASFAIIEPEYPWFNAYCGDTDLIGDAKPQLFYKRVLWGASKLEMVVQRPVPEGQRQIISAWGWADELKSWTWPGCEGTPLTVRVYSKARQVRLLVNGREMGVKAVSPETRFAAEFEVPYAAGELKAEALENGSPVAELAFNTAGKPAKLALKADRPSIRCERNDLAYVTVEVLDATGNLAPDATVPVTFHISGAGELAATGSANPKDVRSFRRPVTTSYHGKCLAIVRPKGSAGWITLLAKSAGLDAAQLVLKAR
jgi:beta-galactosidase